MKNKSTSSDNEKMWLSAIEFKNDFVDSLPGDRLRGRETRQVHSACYSLIEPETVAQPQLLGWSSELGSRFGLRSPREHADSMSLLAGNLVLPAMKPFAACYGGHQFGRWAGQLGDGRAICLGEILDINGQPWELQLKGAGRTPYSRFADGRAVLRSSLREFLASEAMFHLGVPTTRALSLVATGSGVVRDMFYDGHPHEEPGAITARMAPSFLRFGSFEIHSSRQDMESLKTLVDWTIDKHFKQIVGLPNVRYALWFEEICRRTAKLVVEWDRVGFVHGVMNTDNMSILGLTIDYGPFGWMDSYDPKWTPNTTDLPGRRYCFGNQASVALWNLERLADALCFLVDDEKIATSGLQEYVRVYKESFQAMMAKKLGLRDLAQAGDRELLVDLLDVLQMIEIDMTLFYRNLSQLDMGSEDSHFIDENYQKISEAFYGQPSLEVMDRFKKWLAIYVKRSRFDSRTNQERRVLMNQANPKFIPRNYLLYQVIQDLEKGETRSFEDLYHVLQKPYEENPAYEYLAAKRPEWARSTAGCSTLSCSS